MVRSPVAQFSVQGRMAQGVKLVRLSDGATLVSVSVCEGAEEEAPDAVRAEDILNATANVNTPINEGEVK